jgi:hypothetical protein
MPTTLTELDQLSTDVLYRKLLGSDADDRNIKMLLQRRFLAGDTPQAVRQSQSLGLEPSDLETKPSDTELTKMVKEAYLAGYRCDDLNNPDQGVFYMEKQILLNKPDHEIMAFDPVKNFWAMFKDHYVTWKLRRRGR